MSKFLRNVYTLKHTLFALQGFRRGLLEPSPQICNFSSKTISKGKNTSKLSAKESGDENISKKNLTLQKALDRARAIDGIAISSEGKKQKSKSSGKESADGNMSKKDLALRKALDQTSAIGGNVTSFEGKKKSKSSGEQSGVGNMSKKDLVLQKASGKTRVVGGSVNSFKDKKKSNSTGNKTGDGNMTRNVLTPLEALGHTKAVDGSPISFEGKKKSKSSGEDSGVGNMSNKDLVLQKASRKMRAVGGSVDSFKDKKTSNSTGKKSGDGNMIRNDLAPREALGHTKAVDGSAISFEGKKKSKSTGNKSIHGNMPKKKLALRKTLDKMRPIDGSAISFEGKKKSKPSGNKFDDGNVSKKDLALQKALDQISTSFGKDTLMWVAQSGPLKSIPVVSTGSLSLDMALGIGGLPKGRIVEIYGPEASGKTTLALHIIAEAQKQGGYCAFISAERLDPAIPKICGLNTENLLLSPPESGEPVLSLVDSLIRSGAADVVVVNKVNTLLPKGEFDGDMGDAHMAMQARLMRQALFKLRHSVSLSRTILIFLNQVSTKLSAFRGSRARTEVTCGGNDVMSYASVRLNIRRTCFIKKGEEVVGSKVLVKIVKNKHGPPFRTAQFDLEFGKGISRESEIIYLGLQHKCIEKAGSAYYNLNGHKFYGKEALKKFLADNDDTREKLVAQLKEKLCNSSPEKEYEPEIEEVA